MEGTSQSIQQGASGTPAAGAQQAPGAPAPQTSQTPAPPVTPGAPRTYTDEEVKELVSKARSDEKSKVYSKLDEVKAEKEKAETKLKELDTQLKSARTDLDAVRTGKQSEVNSILEEMKTIRETNDKLSKAIEDVASNAAAQIALSKVETYREKRIRDAGIQLEELVTGTTMEEIDSAIAKAKVREDALLAKAREDLAKQMGAQLPKPTAPDGSQGRDGGAGITSLENRRTIAAMKGPEYAKHRAKLLKDAKTRANLKT